MAKKDISKKALQLYLKEIEKYSDLTLTPEEEKEYLKEIEKYSDLTLTPEEEKELAKRIEKGDEEAKKKLVRANLILVVKVAKYYAPRSKKLTMLDLIQEGNLGLFRATELYNWRSNYRFSTFAILAIGMAIHKALMGKGEVLPLSSLFKSLKNN